MLVANQTIPASLIVVADSAAIALTPDVPASRLACVQSGYIRASRAMIDCERGRIDIHASVTGYDADVVSGGRMSRVALHPGVVLDAGSRTFVVDSIPANAYGFWREVNGRTVRTSAPEATPFLGALNRVLGEVISTRVSRDANVAVTLDQTLNAMLQTRLETECPRLSAQLRRCSVLVVDPATGDIVSLASYVRGNLPERRVVEPNFQNHRSASVVKPLLAASVLSEYPMLQGMKVTHQNPATAIAGWPLEVPLNSPVHQPCGNEPADFYCFLAGSNNNYAATLGFMGLAPKDSVSHQPIMQGTRPALLDNGATIVNASQSPLANGFKTLFDATITQSSSAGYDSTLWIAGERLEYWKASDLWGSVSPEKPRLPLDELAAGPNPFWALATFMYGDRDNNWSNYALVRGLVRIMNDRGTNLRVIRTIGTHTIPNPDKPGVRIGAGRMAILKGLQGVVTRGTASALSALPINNRNGFAFYGKTGTLNNSPFPGISSFLFGITSTKAACRGVAGIVFIEYDGESMAETGAAMFNREIAPILSQRYNWEGC
jgi:hypothetical protein